MHTTAGSTGLLRRFPRTHVRLLPLTLGAILLGTALPVELRSEPYSAWEFNAADFILNVILYLPFGVMLPRRKLIAVVLTAGILSAVIETLQLWHVGRFASPFDVIANTFGTGLGWLFARASLRGGVALPVAVAIDRRIALVATTTATALLLAWNLSRVPVNLSTWDRSFALLVMDEVTRNRPWKGDIASVVLLTEGFDERGIRRVSERLGLPSGLHLVTRAGPVASVDLLSAAHGLRADESELVRSFHSRAVSAASFAVVATIKPGNVSQTGPARIVTYSIDPFNRNFDLGQEGDRLVFRVRTPATTGNGMGPHVVTEPTLTDAQYVTIVAAFDGAVSRVFVDGILRGRANVEAGSCVLPTLCDSDLPLGAAVLGMVNAILLLFFVGRMSRSWLVGASLFGGLVAAALALAPFSWMAPPIAATVGLSAVLGATAVCLGLARERPSAADGTI